MATFNPFNPDGSWNWENIGFGREKDFQTIWEEAYEDFKRRNQQQRELTEEIARQLILSNLDKFDAQYAEYWQRQRRMQMNEAKSKIGQLSIVHVPTVQETFVRRCCKAGASDYDAAMLAETVWSPLSEKSEAYDKFVSRVMSPLFQWNC